MKPTRRARRRIAVVTGTRAEYGLLKSVMTAITEEPRLELLVASTGMHLLKSCGSTVHDIERDGFEIAARVRMQRGDDSPTDQAEGLARGVAGLARFLDAARADIVLVLGDRIEALAGALAATTTGRILAHIHGGDVARGDFDEAIRHAITKLAHLHFTATRDARRRVLRMGESPSATHFVGAPGLDDLRAMIETRTIAKSPNAALIVQHPIGRAARVEEAAMRTILGAAAAERLDATVIYPNTDRGHSGIARAIERDAARLGFRVVRSLPRREFLAELLCCRLIIGNSSSGAIEAPFAGAAFVCVGDRQVDRQTLRGAMIPASENSASIRRAIRTALRLRLRAGARTPYGDGRAGQRIATILASCRIDERVRRKRITY